jgi:hypothetical protein
LTTSIFIGQALVEAYEYGEGQDWVGFLLCPSASAAMRRLGVPMEQRLHYAPWAAAWKRKPTGAPDSLGACILGSWYILNNGENPCRRRLEEMASKIDQDHIKVKYDRAIQFIADHPRGAVVDG